MRISDWSSDVCSSDLGRPAGDRWRTGSSCGSYRLSLGVVGIGLRRLGGGPLGAATEGCGEQALVLAAGTVALVGDQARYEDPAALGDPAQVAVAGVVDDLAQPAGQDQQQDRKSTRLNSSH